MACSVATVFKAVLDTAKDAFSRVQSRLCQTVRAASLCHWKTTREPVLPAVNRLTAVSACLGSVDDG